MSYRQPPTAPLLFVTFGEVLHALESESGELRWTNRDVGKAAGGALIHHGSRLYLAGWGWARCADVATGKTIWSCDTGVPGRCGMILQDDRLFIGGSGEVACVSIDGALLWRNGFPGQGAGDLALAIAEQHARDDRNT